MDKSFFPTANNNFILYIYVQSTPYYISLPHKQKLVLKPNPLCLHTLAGKSRIIMTSACISSCVNDVVGARSLPVRATYINLYKWPESDVEFISSRMKSNSNNIYSKPKVVDSISCRQLYLRSYTFSREEECVNDKATITRCYGRGRKKISRNLSGGGRRRKCNKGLRRAKEISCAAFASIFRRLLSCTVKVDVVG